MVAVLGLVVDRCAPLHDVDQALRVQRFVRARGAPDFLGEGEGTARPSPFAMWMSPARLGLEGQGLGHRRSARVSSASRASVERGRKMRHAGARQERRVRTMDLFRRRGDEGDRAVLHHRQEGPAARG